MRFAPALSPGGLKPYVVTIEREYPMSDRFVEYGHDPASLERGPLEYLTYLRRVESPKRTQGAT